MVPFFFFFRYTTECFRSFEFRCFFVFVFENVKGASGEIIVLYWILLHCGNSEETFLPWQQTLWNVPCFYNAPLTVNTDDKRLSSRSPCVVKPIFLFHFTFLNISLPFLCLFYVFFQKLKGQIQSWSFSRHPMMRNLNERKVCLVRDSFIYKYTFSFTITSILYCVISVSTFLLWFSTFDLC